MNKSTIKKIAKTLLSLGFGIFIVWILYRGTDIDKFKQIIFSANFWIIAFSLIFGLIGNIFRALRWKVFIKSFGYVPRTSSVIYSTLGNYAVNFVFPRAGDIWRCAIVSKKEQVPFGKSFETFIVDKVLDIVVIIAITILSFFLSTNFFFSYFHKNYLHFTGAISFLSNNYIYLILFILFIILVFYFLRNSIFVKKIKNLYVNIIVDLKKIAKMKEKQKIFLYTIGVWISFYLYFYICFFAFDFSKDLGVVVSLVVFSMCNIGVAVPIQGGIGAWHFMVISSFAIFGISYDQASAFAMSIFTIQSIWIILCGIFGILALSQIKNINN